MILFMINLSLGVLSFLLLLHNSLQKNILSLKAKTISRTAGTFFSVALYLAFIFHLAGYCLRWYIGGRIPLSNCALGTVSPKACLSQAPCSHFTLVVFSSLPLLVAFHLLYPSCFLLEEIIL